MMLTLAQATYRDTILVSGRRPAVERPSTGRRAAVDRPCYIDSAAPFLTMEGTSMFVSVNRCSALAGYVAWLLLLGIAASSQAQVLMRRIEIPGHPGATAGWSVNGTLYRDNEVEITEYYFDRPRNLETREPVLAFLPFDKTRRIENPVARMHAHGFSASNATIPINATTRAATGTSVSVAYPEWQIDPPLFPATWMEFSGGANCNHTDKYEIVDPQSATYVVGGPAFVQVSGNENWDDTQESNASVIGPGIRSFAFRARNGTITPAFDFDGVSGPVRETKEYPGYRDVYERYTFGRLVAPFTFEVGASASSSGGAILAWGTLGTRGGNEVGNARYTYDAGVPVPFP